MRVKEITITKGVKITHNYNSIDGNVGVVMVVDEGDKVKDVFLMTNKLVDDELEKILEENQKQLLP